VDSDAFDGEDEQSWAGLKDKVAGGVTLFGTTTNMKESYSNYFVVLQVDDVVEMMWEA
jgi:hypothetical protein